MENRKQTAVEWLIYWMGKNQYFIGNDLLQAVNQAMQMEKEQIIEAGNSVDEFPNSRPDRISFGEQYYKETYGK